MSHHDVNFPVLKHCTICGTKDLGFKAILIWVRSIPSYHLYPSMMHIFTMMFSICLHASMHLGFKNHKGFCMKASRDAELSLFS